MWASCFPKAVNLSTKPRYRALSKNASGKDAPLASLQFLQASTLLLEASLPPADKGTRWSTVKSYLLPQ